MRYVSYLRVSTKKQGKSGLGLEAQRAEVARYVESQGGKLEEEFVEVESGTKKSRPVLNQALEYCALYNRRKHEVTLVIARLDRLSRSAAFLTTLQEAGVPFVACDLPEANELLIGVMALLARQERDLISKRTKEALAAKKARGETWERYKPPKGVDTMQEARERGRAAVRAQAKQRAEQYRGIFEALEQDGYTSLNAKARKLTEDEVPNPSGTSTNWTPVQVGRIEKRLDEPFDGEYLL